MRTLCGCENGFEGILAISGKGERVPVFGLFTGADAGWCDSASRKCLPADWDTAVLCLPSHTHTVQKIECRTYATGSTGSAIGCCRARHSFRVLG